MTFIFKARSQIKSSKRTSPNPLYKCSGQTPRTLTFAYIYILTRFQNSIFFICRFSNIYIMYIYIGKRFKLTVTKIYRLSLKLLCSFRNFKFCSFAIFLHQLEQKQCDTGYNVSKQHLHIWLQIVMWL